MAPSQFPRPPFGFDHETPDKPLIEYLQGSPPPYLTSGTQTRIQSLKPSVDLHKQQKTLLDLWPAILTDALKGLKKDDPRECGRDGGFDFDSFFNEHSLGMDRLKDVLEAFKKFEGLMYGARPSRYRDHVTHVFRVWVIGHGLLKQCFKGKLATAESLGSQIKCREWECIWAITALCHDIGYPVSALDTINERTREALRAHGLHHAGDLQYVFSARMQPLQDTVLRLMSSKLVEAPTPLRRGKNKYLTHLQNKYYLKFLNSFDRLDHGVVSALVVGRSLVYFLEADLCQDMLAPLNQDDAKQFLIRREILRAVAAHTCPEIYHLRFNSLAFLLFVVDELQCWGRPTFEQMLVGAEPNEDDEVHISDFTPDNIEIKVTVGGEWSQRQRDVEAQLTNIRKRLRLAVDTPMLKDLAFSYQVNASDGSQGHHLRLKDGSIAEESF